MDGVPPTHPRGASHAHPVTHRPAGRPGRVRRRRGGRVAGDGAGGGISLAQARAIALKAAPGKIVKEEREKEDGALRYSFDIRQDGRIHEVGVDVATGKIVEDKFEDPANRD